MSPQHIIAKTRVVITSLLDAESRRKLQLTMIYTVFQALADVVGIGSLAWLVQWISFKEMAITLPLALQITLLLLSLFLIKNLISILITKVQASFTFEEAVKQSRMVMKQIFGAPETFFFQKESGSLISDMMYVPTAFANGVMLGYVGLITEGMVAILIFLLLAITVPGLLWWIFLILAPAAWISYQLIRKAISRSGVIRNEQVKQAQDILIQGLQARIDLLLARRTGYIESRFMAHQQVIGKTDATVFTLNNIPVRLIEVFAVAGLCCLYLWHLEGGNQGTLAFQTGLFVAAAFRLLPSINRMVSAVLRIKNHEFAAQSLLKYQKLEQRPVVVDPPFFTQEITIQGLIYHHQEHFELEISAMKFQKGTMTGIGGPTGSGKSTLLKLIAGILPPQKGRIWVDGQDLVSYTSLNNLCEWVKQDVSILNDTLAGNITLADTDHRDVNRLNQIITTLGLEQLAPSFKDVGKAGEEGSQLSGGQKKLIALGRAAYFDKPIWLLDETFASMDAMLAQHVMTFLEREVALGRTVILVSHQPEILNKCHVVYQLKQGKLT